VARPIFNTSITVIAHGGACGIGFLNCFGGVAVPPT
jgi:hypothetical protein